MLSSIRSLSVRHFVPFAPFLLVACQSTGAEPVATPDTEVATATAFVVERPDPVALCRELKDAVDRDSLAQLHELVASRPHPAGSPGDEALIDWMASYFEDLGLEVEVQPFWALLSFPISAELELVSPERLRLPLAEDELEADPFSSHAELDFGWNAYSASAEVHAEVVYANYGRLEDFAELARRGVDCSGKIVLARYGGNYRGYKAKYAEEAGAAGLVIFTDPSDAGWGRGLSWPEGGWSNGSSIQRGSILTLPYYGDPTTPGAPSTQDAERIDLADIGLPTIPVQPIGWDAAQSILQHMSGPEAPQAWQGGLPQRYRLTGGSHLKLRLAVEQERRIARTANVVATLRGTEDPDQAVVLGSHHDAWTFGAGDPCAGLICVLEAARVWAESGVRPRRSISFACWGAEEHGIVGSVEWIEAELEGLRENGVAYLNLDMAAMGMDLRASASPSLQRVLARAAELVPTAGDRTALEDWIERAPGPHGDGLPAFGDLGGGSDHAGFVAHAGLPSAAVHAGGAEGVSYHSAYDDLAWYRSVVGGDYASAELVTRMVLCTSTLLADESIVPLDPARFGPEALRHLEDLTRRGRDTGAFASGASNGEGEATTTVDPMLAELAEVLTVHGERVRRLAARLTDGAADLDDERRQAINALLVGWERAWLDSDGLPGRPWYQNLFAATDETSGYAAWMLPALRWAVERGDGDLVREQLGRYEAVVERLEANADRLEALLERSTAGA